MINLSEDQQLQETTTTRAGREKANDVKETDAEVIGILLLPWSYASVDPESL